LKSPTTIELGLLPASKLVGVAKLSAAHIIGVVTVKENVWIVLAPPLSKALTVIV
jgi:hypothetical protein